MHYDTKKKLKEKKVEEEEEEEEEGRTLYKCHDERKWKWKEDIIQLSLFGWLFIPSD